ncbi:Na/Pi cotransporter family protein [bacterium]|nr:Na/Pi cotransporter family protein [bacterium]
MQDPAALNWFELAVTSLGGLALFLFGLEQLSGALKTLAGRRLKRYIAKAVATPLRGLLTGVGVTAVMQSSSMTTTLLIGFVGAGLMSLRQAIPVLMGAEIGTTVTAQLIAFRVSEIALLLVFGGWLLSSLGRRQQSKIGGRGLMGLGLLFFGMQVLRSGLEPLQQQPELLRILSDSDNHLLAIALGMLVTAAIQSSTAFIGIVIALASQGLIELPTGIALSLGANIGTCITGVLASARQPGAARQVAGAQVAFNVVGVLLFAPFLTPFAELVRMLSPASPELAGTARLAAEVPRQLANAHSVFNLSMALVCIGLTGPLAALVSRLLPYRPVAETLLIKPRYLSTALLGDPSSAQEMVRLELGRLGERVLALVEELPEMISATEERLRDLRRRAEEIDVLYEQVLQYQGRISLSPLNEEQRQEFLGLMKAAGALQHMGSVVARHFIPLGELRAEGRLPGAERLLENTEHAHELLLQSVRMSLSALAEDDEAAARQALAMEEHINEHLAQLQLSEAQELGADDEAMQIYPRKMVLLENFKRIEYFSRRIARSVITDSHAES